MKKYLVYFEAFGRKLKIHVLAHNEIEAREKVLSKIKFYRAEEKKMEDWEEVLQQFDELFK